MLRTRCQGSPRRSRRGRVAGVVAAAASAALLAAAALLPPPAPAAAASADVVGNATHFDGLGSPYGGCGLPQDELDSQDFVALNVFNTPGDYGSHPRPIPPSMASAIGAFDNGLNCGRWVRVTIGDYCTGTNDGAPGQPFCRGGSWVPDAYNGATLTMLVADSCADANAWCRDDPNHLDLATGSLNRFVLGGSPVGDMYPGHWNNRHVSWSFVPAPDYSGDIRIGFLQQAQPYWPAVAVSHLPDGIHGVQYLSGGTWVDATMNGDMGQSYILGPTSSGGTQYTIRIRDASDGYLFGGRTYSFGLPSSCGGGCPGSYTPVGYTTQDPGPTPTATPSASATPSAGASPTPTPPASPSTGPTAGAHCAAGWQVTSSWPGGFQVNATVADDGPVATTGWAVHFALPAGDTVAGVWNAAVDSSAPATTVRNASYDAAIAPGATTSWGMTLNGSDQSLGAFACAAS